MNRRILAGSALASMAVAGFLGAQAGAPAPKAPTASSRSYDSYKIIVERNIFSASRRPAGSRPRKVSTAPTTSNVLLAGVVVSEDARSIIFTSSIPEHSGKRTVGDAVAGFPIESADTDGIVVTLNGTSRTWPVGAVLRRIDDGDWYLPEAPGASTDIAKDPAAEAAILKRMRERRLQEKNP